jgi:P pilus assembly chaperone PapD
MSLENYQCFLIPLRTAIISALFAVVLVSSASAQLLISPLRVVFEGRDRSATIIITNQGDEAATYRLEWQEKAATPDGQYANIEEPGPETRIASRYVRFSPRQVTLAPGERQQVRLALRRPADLPSGEYRSHLAFVIIDERQRRAARQDSGGGAAIQVFMNLGFAVPIIVRHGNGAPGASLAGAELDVDSLSRLGLKIQLNQQGTFSAYGRLRVYWRQNQNSPESQIGLLQNVAVYPDIQSRLATVLLDQQQLPPGILRIEYQGADEYAGRTWFDQSFQIGN